MPHPSPYNHHVACDTTHHIHKGRALSLRGSPLPGRPFLSFFFAWETPTHYSRHNTNVSSEKLPGIPRWDYLFTFWQSLIEHPCWFLEIQRWTTNLRILPLKKSRKQLAAIDRKGYKIWKIFVCFLKMEEFWGCLCTDWNWCSQREKESLANISGP